MDEKKEQNFVEMTLGDHLEELRLRIIFALLGIGVGLAICLFYAGFFLSLLAKPYLEQAGSAATLQAITLSEKFFVYMKTALLFGIILSSPWVFYQLWKFVSAGLYKNEKKFIYIIAPVCALLFIIGALFFLFVMAPVMIKFFIDFDPGIKSIKTQVTLSSYIDFMLVMMLIFGACFQLPVAIVAANRIGILPVETLKKARRYVLLAIFIIAAIVTPTTDVVTQTALAVPMYILYELGILFCRR
ncbi:MAG: twin-arginine translocase subunit TatC [Sedimentisphaerales bacterium]